MSTMLTVEQAVHAFVLRSVATLEDHGQRVWWKRCPWMDGHDNGHTFAYWMAVNDDEHEVWFEPRYHGELDDLIPENSELPEGFYDFTLMIAGGKFELDLLIDHGARPGSPMNTESRREVRDDEGRLLKFVTRLPDEQDPTDWLTRPDAYLCCSLCEALVAVADQEAQCPCGELGRGPDGALLPPDPEKCFPAVYRLAP